MSSAAHPFGARHSMGIINKNLWSTVGKSGLQDKITTMRYGMQDILIERKRYQP